MIENKNMYDIIYSNIDYIDKLLIEGIAHDNISESALKSYYVHTYFMQIENGGFSQLEKTVDKIPSIIYYIRHGLKSIRAIKNLNLFNQYLTLRERDKQKNYTILDKLFIHINREENILELNSNWIKSNDQLSIKKNININKYKNINIKILKKLCKIANEEYVRITSYDQNNLYNDTCHFKTIHSYFYMIKERKRYVMYNSFTKREVSSVRVKEVEKNSFFSTLWKSKH